MLLTFFLVPATYVALARLGTRSRNRAARRAAASLAEEPPGA